MELAAWMSLGLVAIYVLVPALIHPLARRWVRYWHGEGEAHQCFVYRCQGCMHIVTWRRIRAGGCGCGAIRLRPAVLTLGEKARLLYVPWSM